MIGGCPKWRTPDTDRVYPELVEGIRCRVHESERSAEQQYKVHLGA